MSINAVRETLCKTGTLTQVSLKEKVDVCVFGKVTDECKLMSNMSLTCANLNGAMLQVHVGLVWCD